MLLDVVLLSYGEAPLDGNSYRVCCEIDIVYSLPQRPRNDINVPIAIAGPYGMYRGCIL